MTPIRQQVRTIAREEYLFETFAFAEVSYPAGYGRPAVVTSWMLIAPKKHRADDALAVGMSCRICAVEGCPARREPSIVRKALADTEEISARL